MHNVLKKLTDLNKTISTMESCTGGYLANIITNVEGASKVFKYGAITYSNEYKIKFGVSNVTIDKYTVYSIEVANEMAKCITNFANCDYGIGITGKLNKEDCYNKTNENNIVYISIYDKSNNKFYNKTITVSNIDRKDNKETIVNIIIDMLENIIK